jgi:xanthine/CO dehydrogenase XdhC/CoxF family maturation factor
MSAFPRPATSHIAVKPDPSPRELPRSRVEILEEEVKAARRRVALSMRELRRASVREQGIRHGEVGRALWRLIEQGQLEGRVIDLIRAELRGHLTPAQAVAFRGTVFEL